ncbi:adenylosuccinate synthase [bacterium]|nr:MAG: adenylosuccinate synthase [bacterium]
MSTRVVIGAQWGDEGKGKIIDLLSNKVSVVARYQGGANAGHTLKFDNTTIVLHLVPSGVFHDNTECVIGNGVVIDPLALLTELEEVRSHNINPEGRLFISESAHVIMSYHKVLDQAREKSKGDNKIGTTGRGIGPAYVHKYSRNGVRMMDLLDAEVLRTKVEANVTEINHLLEQLNCDEKLEANQIVKEMLEAGEKLKPFVCDTGLLLHNAQKAGKNILLEGAQGALLDVDHGTYPFVTSSSPTSGGACTGTGLPPTAITHVMGIMKAYCTRVGNGPFPTELHNEIGEEIRKIGHEFGATTGRPRRTGWLDLVALKYACRINGINELAVTKLDVLDAFEEIQICTAYDIDGVQTDQFPLELKKIEKVKPVYTALKGWNCDTTKITDKEALPQTVKDYVAFIETYLEVPVVILSTGPKRKETLFLQEVH